MTPAALKAAASGDMENLVAAMTPGGIEAQEKRGQIEQSFAETLPVDMGKHRPDFEALGFVFGKSDKLFIEAKFPKGWRKNPTDHSMWSEIVDDQGRKRGMIFYKAAFYDQRAHAHLETRFHVADDCADKERTVSVSDACGKVDKKITGLKAPDWNGNRDAAKRLDDKIEAAKGGSLHRACSTCSFYEEEFCKRRAPEVIYEQFGPLMPKRKTVWPITGPKDWCGEYEAR